MTTFEKSLMRGMGLKSIEQLDEILVRPTSESAARHSEPPDEEYDLADRMYAEADRQRDAQQRFSELSESKYQLSPSVLRGFRIPKMSSLR
jgi:hypothetical protein